MAQRSITPRSWLNAEAFALEPLAEHFFPERVADPDIDWKLLALEVL